MRTKLLFFLLPFLLISCANNQESEEEIQPGDGYVDVLPSSNDEGIILHAFNWKYEDIKNNLEAIKNAGYKMVQTSPVQQPKSGGARWEFFYQPVSFSIGDSSPLGTKQDLKDLCDAAEKEGISIICDIVFNHLATDGGKDINGLPTIDPEIENYEPYIYAHQDECFHHYKTSDVSGSGHVTMYYPGLPDLNTANEKVQERSLALLKECIDVGVDGFRFDAAKHIETPEDKEYPSNFWVNTLEAAKTYYHEKTNNELFAYGEILNDVDGGRDLSLYTKYMKVTDNGYIGSGVFNAAALRAKDASLAVNAEYGKKPANKIVTWVESHDTFTTDGYKYLGLDETRLARMWAIVASRKDTNTLFFARTDAAFSVAKVSSYEFERELIGAVNRFHNRFIGKNEYQNAQEEHFYINERYDENDQGAIIVDLALEGSKKLSFAHLPDGYYFDQITGQQIHIKKGKAVINFDASGICVLTKTNNAPRASITASKYGGKYYKPFELTLNVNNAKEAYYQIDDGEKVSFTNEAKVNIGQNKNAEDITKVYVYATNGEFITTKTFEFEKLFLIDGYFNIINFNKDYLTDYTLYLWTWDDNNSIYTQTYSWNEEHQILLVSDVANKTGFLLALFEKDHTISNTKVWQTPLKQTADIYPSSMEYFDASSF
jgi:alpha-amylase